VRPGHQAQTRTGGEERLRDWSPRGIVDHHDLTLARSIFGLGRERRGQAERIGPTLVVDNDDGQPRSAAIGGSGLMGSKRLVHTVNPKGPAGLVGSALIFGITQI
jgi:hypothetical protein